MFRIIHPNRWFIWTISLIVMIFIVVWGAIQRYAIEQEYQYTSNEIYYSVRLHKKQLSPAQNLAGCRVGDTRHEYLDFGSQALRVISHGGDLCEVEYTYEIEGGYAIYRCLLPVGAGSPQFSDINLEKNCNKIRSGNLLLEQSQ